MEVLYNSQADTDIVNCAQCKSTLKINPHDLFRKNVSLFASAPAFKCPICGKTWIYQGTLKPWYENYKN